MIKFTKYESPTFIGKKYSLSDGKINKTSNVQLFSAMQTQEEVGTIEQFRDELINATSFNVFSYGISKYDQSFITTVKLGNVGESNGMISETRTKDNFSWNNGPGVLFLDYDLNDVQQAKFDEFELIEAIRYCVPYLKDVKILWTPSASSNIRFKDGKVVNGLKGQHMYMIVSDATKIKEIGEDIHNRLWLNGLGYWRISKDGKLLDRSMIDCSVWQPERIDFVGPVILSEELERFDYLPRIHGSKDLIDNIEFLTTSERLKVDEIKLKAKILIKPQADIVAGEFVKEQSELLMVSDPLMTKEQAEKIIRQRSFGRLEIEDYLTEHLTGKRVKIKDMLNNPSKWDKKQFSDPIEPTDDTRVCILFLSSRIPVLYSHMHGGKNYFIQVGMKQRMIEHNKIVRKINKIKKGMK